SGFGSPELLYRVHREHGSRSDFGRASADHGEAVTKRTPMVLVGGFSLSLTFIGCQPAPQSAFPTFEYHRIDNIGNQIGQTALVDLDDDGDLDWIAGQARRTSSTGSSGGDVWWWEYRGPDNWIRH